MNELKYLEDYPRLSEWFNARHPTPPSPSDPISQLLYAICRSLTQEEGPRVKLWTTGVENFFARTHDKPNEFLRVESLLQDLELDFFAMASEIAESAIRINQGASFQRLMQGIADKSELSVFRFLSAWSALNNGALETCIEECEKIDDAFACVHTLQGQAFLELGLVEEAIEALTSSVSINQNDTLAYFQLAKAYSTKDLHDDAWAALEACNKLSPGHPEVITLKAITGLRIEDRKQRAQKLSQILPDLLAMMRHDARNIDLLFLTMDVVFSCKTKEEFSHLINIADWDYIKTQPQFMMQSATILRELDRNSWKDLTLSLLQVLTSQTRSA